MWAFAFFALVSQLVLFGVLGHFESIPSDINTANGLFIAALAVAGFEILVASGPVAYFGIQFLTVITDSLKEMEQTPLPLDGRGEVCPNKSHHRKGTISLFFLSTHFQLSIL